MTEEEALEQLRRVFVAYPSYRQWARDTGYGDETIDAWAAILRGCDYADVVAIVSEIVAGKREPTSRFEKPDAMPRNIAREARERRGRRTDSKHQRVKYHQSIERLADKDQKFGRAWREGLYLGSLVKSGRITKAEHDDRMALVLDWLNGSEVEPAWHGDSVA